MIKTDHFVFPNIVLGVQLVQNRGKRGGGGGGGGVEIPVQMIFYHTSKPIVEWWRNEAVCRIQIGENGPGVLPRR